MNDQFEQTLKALLKACGVGYNPITIILLPDTSGSIKIGDGGELVFDNLNDLVLLIKAFRLYEGLVNVSSHH